jgi:hypothetical protein
MKRALLLLVTAFACLQLGPAQAKLVTGSLPIHIDHYRPDGPDECGPGVLDCGNATLSWSFDKHDNHSLEYAIDFRAFNDLPGGPAGWAQHYGAEAKFFDVGDVSGLLAWTAALNIGLLTENVTIWKPRRVLLLDSDTRICSPTNNCVDIPFEFEDVFFANLTGGSWQFKDWESGPPPLGIEWSVLPQVAEPSSFAVLAAGLVFFLSLGSLLRVSGGAQRRWG